LNLFVNFTGWDLVDAVNPECLGIFYGIIGKVEHNPGLSPRLLLIRSVECIGELPGKHPAYKIKTVAFLNILGADVTQQVQKLPSIQIWKLNIENAIP
jgi:hypothetical protein